MNNNEVFRISDEDFWYQLNDKFENKGGVYIIFSQYEGKIVPINRLLGIDKEGVLYIGKAISFLDRVINLKKTLSPNHISSSHEAGIRLLENSISSRFPYETLYLRLIVDENPKLKEMKMLQNYLKSFGELPPLNRMQ